MNWYKVSQRIYYHGSMDYLPIGTVLTPRDDYESRWGGTDFYHILEMYRPQGMISHKEAVFMVGKDEDLDLAGGGTEYVFKVIPNGRVERHDLNWGSEISMLVSDGYSSDSSEIKLAANNYWNGVPHRDESVWEYLTTSATIKHVEEY
jgi:hypothetical protein